MTHAILTAPITSANIASLRAQVREIGRLVGLEALQRTRFSTAVSEIARNAVQYAGGGTATFLVGRSPDTGGQCVVAEISDAGPGIADSARALRGTARTAGREAMGIPGSRRMVDRMTLEARPASGTVVRLEIDMGRDAPVLTPAALDEIAGVLTQRKAHSPLEEVEHQNRELLRIHQELLEKQAALVKADLRKNQFVMTLAHELRNPLATLDLSITVLRLQPHMSPEDLLKRCDTMARQTTQLTQLVEGLMDVTRVAQGKAHLWLKPVELNDLVSRAVEMTSGATQGKGHDVQVFASPAPVWVSGDETRLTQVLCNLLQNASRYTPPRGSIAVMLREAAGQAEIDVVDNGIGISPELMPHVFELFVQGESAVAVSAGGLGIGLTLVQHLVTAHGGKIDAASEGIGHGCRFTVTLPLTAPADAAPADVSFQIAAAGPLPLLRH